MSVVLGHEDIQRIYIENTTSRWNLAVGFVKKAMMILVICGVVYLFWLAWGFYFWADLLLSLPLAFIVALKLIRVKMMWFLNLDIKTQTLYLYGIPKAFRWKGQALILKDNNGNILYLVHKISYNQVLHSVTTEYKQTDIDRMEMLQDFTVLDRTLERLETIHIEHYVLKRNIWNHVIEKILQISERSVEVPIEEILKNPYKVDLNGKDIKQTEKGDSGVEE